MNRRYIASLAVAAFLTLVAGLVVRQRLRSVAPSPQVAPPSEAAALQQLSEETQIRRLASFLDERARDVSVLVEYVPATKASGVRWRGGDTLITTFPGGLVVMLRAPRGDTTRTPLIAPPDSLRGEWVLAVARRSDGGFVATAGVVGGRSTTTCADRELHEYVLGVSLPDAFAGAGLFDLSGRVVGFVARCDRQLIALPVAEVTRLIADLGSLGARPWHRFGLDAEPLDSAARSYFGADSGMLVIAVGDDTPADRAGLLPGDILAQIDSVPIDSALSANVIGALATTDSHTVVIRRSGSRRMMRLSIVMRAARSSSAGPDLGIVLRRVPSAPGVEIGHVAPGSSASQAGLKRGDRLLRVDGIAVTSAAAAQRLLERRRRADSAAFIVFRRDSVSRAVLLRP